MLKIKFSPRYKWQRVLIFNFEVWSLFISLHSCFPPKFELQKQQQQQQQTTVTICAPPLQRFINCHLIHFALKAWTELNNTIRSAPLA